MHQFFIQTPILPKVPRVSKSSMNRIIYSYSIDSLGINSTSEEATPRCFFLNQSNAARVSGRAANSSILKRMSASSQLGFFVGISSHARVYHSLMHLVIGFACEF